MKRKLLISKKRILRFIAVALIIFVTLFFIYNLFFYKGKGMREMGDLNLAKNLERAITSYIILTNDKKSNLGKDSTASIDEILVNLQKDIIYGDGENFGSILIPLEDPPEARSYYPQWYKNYGWRIEVSQKTGKVTVKPYKENKDVLVH